MRKIISLVVSILIILFVATSCSAASNSEIDVLKKQIESLQREIDALEEVSPSTADEADQSKTTVSNSTTATTTVTETQPIIAFSTNQSINVPDVCDFFIESYEFTDVVKPPKSSGYYSYYEIKDSSKTYLHIVSSFKNLGANDAFIFDVYDVSFRYANKYIFNGFTVGEENGGEDFETLPFVAPLTTDKLHTLIEVSDEVANGSEAFECIVTIKGDEYLVTLSK